MASPALEHICAYCTKYYDFVARDSGGWAYCHRFKRHFPNQRNEEKKDDWKPAGMRTCKSWEA